MLSEFFESLLAGTAFGPSLAMSYFAFAAFAISLGCLAYTAALKRRFKRLMLGRNGSIEESIAVLSRETKELKKFRTELEAYLKTAEARLGGSVRGVGVVRFNPFSGDGSGGNQSFAVALLDETGSGVVLSSLYARDRVGMYAKPIAGGASSYELTDEEKKAVVLAKQNTLAYAKKK